jgi:hypothetical protein
MIERPVSDNGYLWVCNAAVSAAHARRIEQQLADIRCEFSTRHLGEVGGHSADTIVELWVHPDDDTRLLARLRGVSDEQ